MDIHQAYHNIPVSPEDRHLLGLQWDGKIYVDQVFTFGLRSAPLIFSAVADGLTWIMLKQGVSWAIHYIDNFLTVGSPGTDECLLNTTLMQRVCERVGLPIELSKSVAPSTSLVFLGIKIDSSNGELCLLEDKLAQLKDSQNHWRGLKACRKWELLSLIGSLSHIAKVIRAGRTFLQRLINLSTTVQQLHYLIRLNMEVRSDIQL